jgi:outer membrane protein assembly factor BamE
MQKLITSAALALVLVGCSGFPGVYKIDVQQGNVVTQEMLDTLEPGMTKGQVSYVMGTPLLTDAFHANRWDYVYTMKTGEGEYSEQRVSLFFENDTLAALSGDLKPAGNTN